MKRKNYTVLKAVRPNVGIQMEYRAKLQRLVDEMSRSYAYFLKAQYRETPPVMAQDAAAKRVTAIQTQVGNARWVEAWHSYVDGELLRGKNGVGRTFQSQTAAEEAGIKAAGIGAQLTEAYSFEDWQKIGMSPFDFLKAAKPARSPAINLQEELSAIGERWQKKIDDAAPRLAEWFVRSNSRRSQASLKKILKDAGISVEFQLTAPMRDVLQATLAENVSLIKSIGSQYHTEVEGLVMRSVMAGRDLASLTKDLQDRYGITKRRADAISLDQNNKATASLVRVRQEQLGLQAIWLHSLGGKHPRPTHVANNGKPYDPKIGWLDPAINKRIWPGTEIRCRCVSASVVPGFSLD